ncbi:FkbM family methyltransferase [Streptomyces sp. NPDC048845]|uniref:FkbM family methyltransferase n=1 Tax=Streptomyces sp. NPDC048845 TaxID=3155390 RepID=UPI0034473A79
MTKLPGDLPSVLFLDIDKRSPRMAHAVRAKPKHLGMSVPATGAMGRRGQDTAGHRRLPGGPAVWLSCAALAVLFATLTSLPTHRFWGGVAFFGYALSAMIAAIRRPWAVRGAAWTAALFTVAVPLLVLAASNGSQLEVRVVEDAARQLLASGTPYDSAPVAPEDYNPYLPGMAVFGLPEAVVGGGPFADARWWFAVCFIFTMTGAARVATGRRGAPGWGSLPVLWLLACPPVALALVVSGIDLPVIGLMCLGLALAARGRSGAAALALGAASALKWTAWPAIVVACVVLAVRYGRRPAARCAALTLALASAVVVPVAFLEPAAFAQHVVAFPLGLADAPSPATSPLPGHLIASAFPGGGAMALGLLCAGALVMAVHLLARPPVTVVAAADRVALGLLVATSLAPATRFGYLLYPLLFCVWFRAAFFATSTGGPMPSEQLSLSTRPLPPPGRASFTSPSPSRRARGHFRVASAHALLRQAGRKVPFVEDEVAGLDQVVRPGDVCLDIGAEYGLYTYSLSALVGPRGTVHSFEPLPGPSRVVATGSLLLSCENVRHHQLALGREPGQATMSLPFRRRLPVHGRAFLTSGADGLGPNTEFASARELAVNVATVDALAAAGCFHRVDFIKADVEGAEPAVLAGAERTIERNRPTLLIEIETRHLAKYGDRAEELVDRLDRWGYHMHIWHAGEWHRTNAVTQTHRNYLFSLRAPVPRPALPPVHTFVHSLLPTPKK